ncbi:HflK protein [Desulfuromonas versatilis]|uniref:Protein HflK n=1 Tax=Desulfuromonas versatilis TaxID=2802975 RepID=A0ABN6E330_9BACT|nr:FtsH protease activity modulator HflK [Desulfuromonas versatilis]BCR06204.1 HflK protein [Desulfuromonas versatilis]
MQDWDWGKDGKEVEQKIIQLADRVKRFRPPGAGLAWVVLLVLLFIGGSSSFYQVGTEETGVLLRFGRFSGFAEPGLHFKLPFGIDRAYLVKTGRVLKEEFGFRTVQAGVRTAYSKKDLDEESLTLTGDLNVSDIEWIVQYQIADPYKFLFRINAPEETIRDISEAVVRKVVGNSNVTEVLTTERAVLASAIEKEMQGILNAYDIGVRIVTVKFQDVNPPEAVKAAFNEVNEAEQQKESLVFQAREQYNREVPKAKGVANATIQEAEGYAIERINKAEGETNRFLALLTEYSKAPEVTRRRLYLETLEEVLPKLEEVYVMDKQGTAALPLLPLRSDKKGGAAQ